MRVEAETIFGRRRFEVEMQNQGRLNLLSWLAVQLIGAAVTIAGPLFVTVSEQERSEHADD